MSGSGSDVGLGETQLRQRRPHQGLARRSPSRTPVGEIVGDRPVQDLRGAETLGHGSQLTIQLGLAVVATVDRVAAEARVGQLAGGHDLHQPAELRGLLQGEPKLALRVRVGPTDHTQRSGTQDLVRHLEQDARVHAPGIRDDDLAERTEPGLESLEARAPVEARAGARSWIADGDQRLDRHGRPA